MLSFQKKKWDMLKKYHKYHNGVEAWATKIIEEVSGSTRGKYVGLFKNMLQRDVEKRSSASELLQMFETIKIGDKSSKNELPGGLKLGS